MSGVGNQRHGIADHAGNHFRNDKADVENKPDKKGAAEIFWRMIMMMVVVMMLVLVIMPVVVAMMIVMAVLVMVVHDLARWFLDFLRLSSFEGARVLWSSRQAVGRQLRFRCKSSLLGEGVA
jgi:flagellar biosynthesis protein FlhB